MNRWPSFLQLFQITFFLSHFTWRLNSNWPIINYRWNLWFSNLWSRHRFLVRKSDKWIVLCNFGLVNFWRFCFGFRSFFLIFHLFIFSIRRYCLLISLNLINSAKSSCGLCLFFKFFSSFVKFTTILCYFSRYINKLFIVINA